MAQEKVRCSMCKEEKDISEFPLTGFGINKFCESCMPIFYGGARGGAMSDSTKSIKDIFNNGNKPTD